MTYKVVVARYNEDVSWTDQFDNIIYNKGVPGCRQNEVMLPNVGREGHTYYTYLYENYDNLPDYVFFLQGRPFDHNPNMIDDIKAIVEQCDKPDFKFLGRVLETNSSCCPIHPEIPMKTVYEKLFDTTSHSKVILFNPGAQFMVSKKLILKNPKEMYNSIIKLLDYDNHPMEGFVIERLHGEIFNKT